MFLHIFLTRLKCVFRDRETVFWTFLFPLILATLFGMAFSNLNKGEAFKQIAIGVVDNEQYRGDPAFQNALSAVSGDSSESGLFHVSLYASEKAADESLKNNDIKGYIVLNADPHVVVKQSGLYQTILKEFMDDYLQVSSAFKTILYENPRAMQSLLADVSSPRDYLKDVAPNKAEPNNVLTYFYALIAMACLYGAFWGAREVSAVQANQSAQGARVNLAPVHKLKVFGYSLCAVIAVQYASILVLIGYLNFVLKVSFGNQIGYVLLASLAGCFMGVSMGALIGAVLKKSEGLKVAAIIGITMISTFLSGLMIAEMKYMVVKAVPVFAYINPANLIADAFYSLYYYSTHTRFFINIALLFIYSFVCYMIVYFVMRRQRYASI